MKTINKIMAGLVILTALMAAGCKKESSSSGYMATQMTNSASRTTNPPAAETPNATAVNVEITSVEVHYDNAAMNSGWVTLNANAGIYDLMKLKNDVTAVLAENTKLAVGHITQMRLLLGTHNSVFIAGDAEYSLTVPSGETSGIKINLDATIVAGNKATVVLDFNSDKSITEANGEFSLKPVIEVKSVTQTKL